MSHFNYSYARWILFLPFFFFCENEGGSRSKMGEGGERGEKDLKPPTCTHPLPWGSPISRWEGQRDKMPSARQEPEVPFRFSMSREQEARKIVEEREGERERERECVRERERRAWGGGGGRQRGFRPSVKDIKNPAASGDTQLSSILLLKCLQNLIHSACHLISPWEPGPAPPPTVRALLTLRLWDSHPFPVPRL